MTRKIHTERPKTKSARIAWDFFVRFHKKPIKCIWFTHLTYPVWVCEFEDGSTEDIDNLALRPLRNREL